MRLLLIVVALCAVANAGATLVRKCGNNEESGVKENPDIAVSACAKLPCKLKRKTSVSIEVKFTPQKDTTKVINSVSANILGVPFPFVGVDGNSVCDKLFDANGLKANCPLKAGQQYVYKDSFKVLEIYPKIKVWVSWSLNDQNGKSMTCFEIPAKIVS